LLELLFKHNIILKKGLEHPKGFVLKSGKTSNIYINMRDILKTPSLFSSIIAALERIVREISVDNDTCFLGIPTMGAVLAPILAVGRQANLAVIRLNKKNHGVGAGAIEGNFTKKIIIIDDVITSGTSVREIEEAYIKTYQPEAEVKIITVIDRQDHNYNNVTSLFTLDDIKEFAKRKTEKNYTTTGEEV
jgi:orotate phosphoribosyltransferase